MDKGPKPFERIITFPRFIGENVLVSKITNPLDGEYNMSITTGITTVCGRISECPGGGALIKVAMPTNITKYNYI